MSIFIDITNDMLWERKNKAIKNLYLIFCIKKLCWYVDEIWIEDNEFMKCVMIGDDKWNSKK